MLASRLLRSASAPILSTVTPNAEGRLSLWSAGNTYTWGCVLRQGTLHLLYTESPSTEHAAGTAAKYKTSTDLGYTWSAATTLYSGSGAPGVHGEAQGLTLSPTGRLIASVIDNADGGGAVTGYIIYSDNGGSSWSSPYTVPISGSQFEKYTLGPAMALPSGTLIMPTTRYSPYDSDIVSSTDDGATWGSQVLVAGSPYTEPQGARMPDGTLVMLMRDDSNQHTWRSASTDNGATWSAAADVLVASGPPQFIQFASNTLFAFLRNNNTQWRPRWTVSRDAGLTWDSLAEVDSGETRELDSAGIVRLNYRQILVVYALANSGSSSTVYRRLYDLS